MEPLEKSIHQTDQVINLLKQTIEIANRLKAEKEALRAENTRLREALRKITDMLDGADTIEDAGQCLYTIGNIVEAAMNPKPL
jgi:regulator of replication initiation timing